nr:carboxylesterase [uncultured Gammaproteobacteria bacterium]
MTDLLPFETVKTAEKNEYTIIWLHGLGADGNDFVPLVPELRLPKSLAIKFIFPHAPVRPITLNNGYEMRAWFDMFSLDRSNNTDESDLLTTVGWINQFIDQEIESGIPSTKILLAGFSQGGVIALHAGLRYPHKLAGVMALSTYMPFDKNLFKQASPEQKSLPIFAVHGLNDPVIPVASWQDYIPKLEAQGFDVEAHSYDMEHSLCAQEIQDVSKWLQRVLI